MKLSRKFALGVSAVLLAAAIGFVSCGTEDDDDEAGAISGSGSNYKVAYKNVGEKEYRAYKTTSTKHYAAIVEVTMNVNNTVAGEKDGVMGFIWNLQKSSEENVKNNPKARDFFIAGCDYKDGFRYYVSKFENVTDMQAENFGTKLDSNPATETQITKSSNAGWISSSAITKDDNNVVKFYLDVYPIDETGTKLEKEADITSKAVGYGLQIYKSYDAKNGLSDPINESPLTIKDIFTVKEGKSSIEQQTNAVYAQVAAGKQLNGTWKYIKSYGAAEVVED